LKDEALDRKHAGSASDCSGILIGILVRGSFAGPLGNAPNMQQH